MKLSDFQTQVSDALIQVKRPVGRPSAASPPLPIPGRAIQRAPVSDVPYDGADHLPEWAPRDRCKSLSFVRCIKCNVFLCLNKETAFWSSAEAVLASHVTCPPPALADVTSCQGDALPGPRGVPHAAAWRCAGVVE
ncbi:hypothetical protein ACOMHN_052172 [Nucella lapillus]